jgi:Zn-finger protein
MARVGWQPDPNLGRGDIGFAKIFATKCGKFIKIVSDDGTCYLWDDTNCLWMHRNNKWIGNEVSNVLEKEFKAEMKKFNGMKLIDVAKKLKATDKDIKRVLSYCRAMDIVHKVLLLWIS